MAKTIGLLTGGGDVPCLNPAMKAQLVMNCTLCDGYVYYVETESATPPADTTTRFEVLSPGLKATLDDPMTYIHWYWDSGQNVVNTITPTAKYKPLTPYLTGTTK